MDSTMSRTVLESLRFPSNTSWDPGAHQASPPGQCKPACNRSGYPGSIRGPPWYSLPLSLQSRCWSNRKSKLKFRFEQFPGPMPWMFFDRFLVGIQTIQTRIKRVRVDLVQGHTKQIIQSGFAVPVFFNSPRWELTL